MFLGAEQRMDLNIVLTRSNLCSNRREVYLQDKKKKTKQNKKTKQKKIKKHSCLTLKAHRKWLQPGRQIRSRPCVRRQGHMTGHSYRDWTVPLLQKRESKIIIEIRKTMHSDNKCVADMNHIQSGNTHLSNQWTGTEHR